MPVSAGVHVRTEGNLRCDSSGVTHIGFGGQDLTGS